MFRDKKVNRKWRRMFRALYGILAVNLLITFLPLNENVETFLFAVGMLAALVGLVFLWFLYNMPEKLKMLDQTQNDFE